LGGMIPGRARPLRLATLSFLLLAAGAARGGSPEFEEHLAAKRWAEAEQLAVEQMQAEPRNAAAGGDLARVIIASRQRARFNEAAQLLEKAAGAEPKVASWHFYLGQVYGRLAQSAGIGGLGMAGRSKASLERAVALEPGNYEYAFALNEYYLEAPFIAGGSVKKARQAAARFASVDRDGSALLSAQVLIYEEEFAKASDLLLRLERRDDNLLDVSRRMLLVRAGTGMVEAGRAAEALPLFTRVTEEFPNNAAGHAGLGRALLGSGDAEGAVVEFARALEVEDAAETWYRLGVAYQAFGDKENARLSLKTALERRLAERLAVDARRRLAALGG
jgi:tetratricopeptide (TPR) repeat protein